MLGKSALSVAVAGLALGALAFNAPARAEAGVNAGVLTCHVDSGWGFVFGSSRDLRCVYTGAGQPQHYSGDISKFGVDIGYLESGVIVWDVLAPTTTMAPGALGGAYGGATAEGSVGVGVGANVLIGGSSHEISLQPLSVEGDKGLNVAAGIASVSLKYQP